MATASAVALLLARVPFIGTLPDLPFVVIIGLVAAALYCLILPLIGCITREDLEIVQRKRKLSS